MNKSYQLVQFESLQKSEGQISALQQPLLSQFSINEVIIRNCDSNQQQSHLSMYEIVYQPAPSKLVMGLLVGVLYCFGLHYLLSFYFVHYTIITFIITLVTLLAVMRAVGIFAMYPGSYRYLAAQIEKTENDNLLYGIHRDMEAVEKISAKIFDWDLATIKRNYHQLYGNHIIQSITTELNVLLKCQEPSTKKISLIDTYKQLIMQLNIAVQLEGPQESGLMKKTAEDEQQSMQNKENSQFQTISLAKIISNNTIVLLIKQDRTLAELKVMAGNAIVLCRKIWRITESIAKIPMLPDDQQISIAQQIGNANHINNQMRALDAHKFEIAGWQLFSQKLFTMNSYYAFWDNALDYTTFMVPLGNNDFIECAIIHGEKQVKHPTNSLNNESNDKQKTTRPSRAVLFSNPNGGFAQTIALSSTYMKFYITLGFQVVLWNYRGYAKSTGIASITKCISDVYKVYKFVTQTYKIKIQVLHGYSIGGVCAINLAHKLNSGSRKPIKLLVADRTFSSIDNVAYGFIRKNSAFAKIVRKISRPLVKSLFPSDCMDNSLIFMECLCNKICIWDTNDTIISDVASLKFSLLKHARKCKASRDEEVMKSEEQSKLQLSDKNVDLKAQAVRFGQAASILYSSEYRIYQRIMKILYDTDGGGDKIFVKGGLSNDLTQTQPCANSIKARCIRYFTGLCVYGPKLCVPYRKFESEDDTTKWIKSRLVKRVQLIENQIMSLQLENQQKYKNQFSAIIEGIYFSIEQLSLENSNKNKQAFGDLIVSQVGHNGDLRKQYQQFERLLKKSIFPRQQKQTPKTRPKQQYNIEFQQLKQQQ